MPSQILRPRKKEWIIRGSWGERRFPPEMGRAELYTQLSQEKFGDSAHPKAEITLGIMGSSWDFAAGKWVDDS